MSDSGNFDAVLELLSKASKRTLPECVMMMIPEAWQDNKHLSNTKRAFYQYNRYFTSSNGMNVSSTITC